MNIIDRLFRKKSQAAHNPKTIKSISVNPEILHSATVISAMPLQDNDVPISASAIEKLIGISLHGTDVTPEMEQAAGKLARSLDEAYKTSRMPLSRNDREILNHLSVELDDFEVRQNEYAVRLHDIYKTFAKETGIIPNPNGYMDKAKEELRVHASKIEEKHFDEENLTAEGLDKYEDCLTRKKAMESVKAVLADKEAYISNTLLSYGIDPAKISREAKSDLAKGKPLLVNGNQMLLKVKTPTGYSFKLNNIPKPRHNENENEK